jgi:hypothetical protein
MKRSPGISHATRRISSSASAIALGSSGSVVTRIVHRWRAMCESGAGRTRTPLGLTRRSSLAISTACRTLSVSNEKRTRCKRVGCFSVGRVALTNLTVDTEAPPVHTTVA